jgi:cell division protein FtsB
MSIQVNRLRKQVASEVRKRKLIFFTIIMLSFVYLLINLIFGDMGLLQYKKLYAKKAHIEEQIKEIQEENTRIRSEIKLLKEEPFYREKHAREDFGLAKPDEYIFQYDR